MNIVPLELSLPDGLAVLVPGSLVAGQPRYERDGIPIDIDVTIPDDLALHWFWQGSFLRLRVEIGTCGVAIFTGTFPPPLCFDQAREIEHIRTELDAALMPKPKRRTKKFAATPQPTDPVQVSMEF